MGALIYLLEMATAIAGELYDVDAFDQPGVELSKEATYALMGRPGYEALAGGDRLRLTSVVRRALWLVGATLAYNVVEAVVAVWAGTEAGSIALLGFGLDSVIECAAAAVLLWRLWVESQVGRPGAHRDGRAPGPSLRGG